MRCSARREDRAGHRGDLAAAEPAQHLERVVEMPGMARERRLHGSDLAREAVVVDAGAAPDPVRGLAAVKRGVDRRRDRGVADAHLADAEEIGAAGDRLHAEGHGGDAGRSSSAGPSVMSPVGRSRARSKTLKPRS